MMYQLPVMEQGAIVAPTWNCKALEHLTESIQGVASECHKSTHFGWWTRLPNGKLRRVENVTFTLPREGDAPSVREITLLRIDWFPSDKIQVSLTGMSIKKAEVKSTSKESKSILVRIAGQKFTTLIKISLPSDCPFNLPPEISNEIEPAVSERNDKIIERIINHYLKTQETLEGYRGTRHKNNTQ